MNPHEPCATRGECYHARAGRIGNREAKARSARNQPHEAKVRGGRIGNREGKARGGHNQPREAKVRAGRIGGRKTQATWSKTPEGREASARGRHLAGYLTAERLRLKPNLGEATVAVLLMTFHPDVWADIIWQRRLPNGLRGVPDLRHPIGVVGEYDGGAHHVFEDRSADDTAKDAERRTAGYAAIRETDPYVLVAKFAYTVRGRFR